MAITQNLNKLQTNNDAQNSNNDMECMTNLVQQQQQHPNVSRMSHKWKNIQLHSCNYLQFFLNGLSSVYCVEEGNKENGDLF